MNIDDVILQFLTTPKNKYYKGMQIGMFGLPVLHSYNKRTIQNGVSRLKKGRYIVFSGSTIKITKDGEKYHAKRKARLQVFDSPFGNDSPRNLILMFDIPEARKAEREWLRRQLAAFGYTMIQKSVWVGPSPLPLEFKSYLKRIGLNGNVKMFKLARAYDEKRANIL